jgi:serine/threonine-protein kinase
MSLVCPRCGRSAREAGQLGFLRCAFDDFVLVEEDDLARSDGDPALGVTIAELFVVLGRIGAGTTGVVYRGVDVRDGTHVAVKLLRADREGSARARACLERQGRVMRRLASEWAVPLRFSGEVAIGSRSVPCLVMSLLAGETLASRLASSSILSTHQGMQLAIDLLAGLEEPHAKGFVHGDLKPDNVFFAREDGVRERAMILDFGRFSSSDPGPDEGAVGDAIGTPRYTSPEQARGEAPTFASDIYAVGAILYRVLVGRPPFADATVQAVLEAHRTMDPVPPASAAPQSGIPSSLSVLVLRALAKPKEARFPSAQAMRESLESVRADAD